MVLQDARLASPWNTPSPEQHYPNEVVRRRFWSKVACALVEEEGCWEWEGALNSDGYGSFKWNGQAHGAHRIAWRLTYGAIPHGKYVLHHCDNRKCCRPSHLFLGSPRDNIRDALQKKRLWQTQKTHCPKGHPYAGDNLYVRPNRWRECRSCARVRKRKQRQRAQALKPVAKL